MCIRDRSALACSISGGSPEEEGTAAATPDQAALVAQAVATITAQLPAATAPAIVSQGAPITTDLEADLIALYAVSYTHLDVYKRQVVAFKQEELRWNHALAGVLLVAAVWLVFKK